MLADERRFRMNVIIEAKDTGFVENGWIGRTLELGDTVRLTIALPDPRCVMTTLPQGDLPEDTDVLRALFRHNKIPVGDVGQFPCAGVYAVITAPGTMQAGDPVALT